MENRKNKINATNTTDVLTLENFKGGKLELSDFVAAVESFEKVVGRRPDKLVIGLGLYNDHACKFETELGELFRVVEVVEPDEVV